MENDKQAHKNFPKSGRGLGHVTRTIFGSMVGYPSDSLASCSRYFHSFALFVVYIKHNAVK